MSTVESEIAIPRFLRPKQVCELTTLSRSEIWRRSKAGTFPAPVELGERRVGYVEAEVRGWMEDAAARRRPSAVA